MCQQHTDDVLFLLLLPIVSTVLVQISTSGTPIAGERYTLMCSVTGQGVAFLNATTNFEWWKSDGSLVSSNAVLTFSPLFFSHEGRYTCDATVSSPYLENDLLSSAVEDISFEGNNEYMPGPSVA